MDRVNTIGTFISSLLMTGILAAISGFIWSFSLNYPLKSGLIYGGLTGLILGFLLFLYQISKTSSSNLDNKEKVSFTGSFVTIIFMISTFIAIIVGLIRWLFF